MTIRSIITAFILLLLTGIGSMAQKRSDAAIYSGIPWYDDKGNTVSAHGANIVKDKDRYYLFGERHTDTSNAFAGFTCYSSADLYNWKFEGIALPVQQRGQLGPNRVGERPKVMKCPATGEYIMYMHVDSLGYTSQFVGYATSNNITGPYIFRGPLLFNGKPIRKWDMGTFQDLDGAGYVLIHGGEIYKLGNDYKTVVEQVNENMTPGFESPAIFRKDSLYYFLGSHLTSWERNDNEYYTATSLKGPWTKRGLFCPEGSLTWNSQTTFVLPIVGSKDTTWMFMGDRWSYPRQASAATYVWQPLKVEGASISISTYSEAWRINTSTGVVSTEQVGNKKIDNRDTSYITYSGEWTNDTLSVMSSAIKNACVTIKFRGTQIGFYALARPNGGYARVTIGNSKGKRVLSSIIDLYCKYPALSLRFLSPEFEKDNYTLTVSVMGEHGNWSDKRKNVYGSTGNFISIDKLVVNGEVDDNTFLNPILSGDYPDPSIMRDGNDYYMTHSAFEYLPGLTIFHSTDLVNWEPVGYAYTSYLGAGWAPDLCKYNGKYYIYFTVANKGNFVVYADNPKGPWSNPIDMNVAWIDPCHVVDETGQRWLFLSGGHRIKLAADGLSVVGKLEKVYDGWKYPEDWETEGQALEGPKVKKIGAYYYMLSAQGGTAGPPTSHMVIVARSTSVNGPWENAPNNPLIHTYSRSERWWSKGHGSLIDAPDGKWWIVYHAYENGFLGLGRQTLLEPVEITADGWLKAPTGTGIEKPLRKPVMSAKVIDRLAHLNAFRIGFDWRFYRKFDSARFSVNNSMLTLNAQGKTPQESAPLLFIAGAHDYEFSVRIEKDSNAVAGLVLFYNADFYVGTGFDSKQILSWRKGDIKGRHEQMGRNCLWLKIRNNNNVVTGFYSYDGMNWKQEPWSRDISGYHHNVLYDFISILPGLFAYGEGNVRFSEFQFKQY